MRNGVLILLMSAVALGGSAYAQNQTHYSCNPVTAGFTTCRDSNGETYTVNEDPFGATITDNHGHRSRVQDDPSGGETIRRSDGSTVYGRTDAFGNTTYDDGQGHQTHCRRSPFALPGQTEEDCQ